MPMTRREWIAPGILITALTLGANFVSAWAVDRYRQDGTEKAIEGLRGDVRKQGEEVASKFEKVNARFDQMAKDGTEMIVLRERNQQLKDSLSELRSDLNSQIKGLRDSQEIAAMQAQKFREELYRKGVL